MGGKMAYRKNIHLSLKTIRMTDCHIYVASSSLYGGIQLFSINPLAVKYYTMLEYT